MPQTPGKLRRFVATIAFVVALSLTLVPVAGAEDEDITPQQTLAMTGLAPDVNLSVYWAVEDPSSSTLVALDAQGEVAGKLTLDTEVTDVQALSSNDGALFVGDIGDKQGNRDIIYVFRVGEPIFGELAPRRLQLVYEDGPQDAAAMMVSPKGNLYIVTRGSSPGLYRAQGSLTAGRQIPLVRLADAPANVTDATFLLDGERMALRTTTGLVILNAFTFKAVASGPIEGQPSADALSLGLQGLALMSGNGGNQPKILATKIPVGFTTATPKPSTSASKSADPSASASASTGSTAAPQSTPASRTQGTLLALLGAAALAIVAGLVTGLARK